MKTEPLGPVRIGITAVGAVVSLILLIAVAFTGLRWSFKTFDQTVDPNSIIKVENVKEVQK